MRVTFWRQSEQDDCQTLEPPLLPKTRASLCHKPSRSTSCTRCTRASSLLTASTRCGNCWELKSGRKIWGDGTMAHEEKTPRQCLCVAGRAGDLVRRTDAITPARDPHPSARPHAEDVGQRAAPKHKLSAAEKWGLTIFSADACVMFKSFLGLARADRLSEAGGALSTSWPC